MTIPEQAELFNEGGADAGCRRLDPDGALRRAVRAP
jgi:hypothetical protein